MTPPNSWEVRFQFARLDAWLDEQPFETAEGLFEWVAECRINGPPTDAWLHELETDHRYRYRLVDLDVNVEFIALTHERRMLITDVD